MRPQRQQPQGRRLHCRNANYRGLETLESRVLLSTATPVGINLEPVTDWSRAFMFVDAMKSARTFGSPAAPWDGAAPVDANGWPTTDFGACVITLNSPTLAAGDFPSIAGTYHFSATGTATIGSAAGPLNITNQTYDPASNTTTADITLPAGSISLYLSFTHTIGGLKNIKLIRPGYAANTTQIFTTAFLNSLASFQTIRLMDFTQTNGNTVVNWADRAKPTDALQTSAKGAAWEYGIELANETHEDLWINVPSHASDDYITQLATLLKTNLDPGLHVYVEYSNEVWNQGFEQGVSNYASAQIEEAANPSVLNYDGSNNSYAYAWRRIVEKLEHVRSIFATVYGSNTTTIRPVLASQIGFSYVLRDQLNFLSHFYGNANQTIYAVAGAPYLNIGNLTTSPTLTTDQVIAALQSNIAALAGGVADYSALASYYRVKNLFYESGIDLEGDTAGNFLNAKLPANYDPRIGTILSNFLTAMYADGADELMYFNESGAFGIYGTWGLTENINNLTGAKFSAVTQFANQPPPAVTIGLLLPSSSTGGTATLDAGRYTANQGEVSGNPGDITFASTGDTYDYLLNSQGGAYSLALSAAASNAAGQLQIILDNQVIGTIAIPNTGGNTAYMTLPAVNLSSNIVPLAAGLHTLRLRIITGGFAIHSLTLESPTPRPVSIIASPASPTPAAPSGDTSGTIATAAHPVAQSAGPAPSSPGSQGAVPVTSSSGPTSSIPANPGVSSSTPPVAATPVVPPPPPAPAIRACAPFVVTTLFQFTAMPNIFTLIANLCSFTISTRVAAPAPPIAATVPKKPPIPAAPPPSPSLAPPRPLLLRRESSR